MVKFGTLEYFKMHAEALSNDPEFNKSGFTSNMMIIFSDVLGPDGQPKAFLETFTNGKATASEAKASDLNNKEIEFGQTATYAIIAGIFKGELNSQKAKLKLNMMKAMKSQKSMRRITDIAKEFKGVEY